MEIMNGKYDDWLLIAVAANYVDAHRNAQEW